MEKRSCDRCDGFPILRRKLGVGGEWVRGADGEQGQVKDKGASMS